ncbi:MAG: SIMPL domain-containing protein [Acidimicrobiia bacterium]
MNARRWAAVMVAVVVAAAFGLGGWATPANAATPPTRRITVSATGQAKGTPDVADVTIGVSANGKAASDALDTANDRAAKVIAALKFAGVADDDIQTSGLSIMATYGDNGSITGYEVSNTVTARLRDVTKAGDVLDGAAHVAGDEIRLQGITFGIDDDSALLATARTRAVKRARAQAQQLADAAGVSLGDVRTIDEGTVAVPFESRSASADAASSVPIEPGTQTLSIQVTVVYAIG